MYLDERSNLLLQEVIGNPEISHASLEEKYQLSRRQVGYSFKKVNDWLSENNYPTIKRTKSGKFIVNPILIELFAEKVDISTRNYILSERERSQFILLMILSSDEQLSLYHFTSALNVSKNTVLRDIKYAQNIVHKYDLEIVYSRLNGYDLSGNEWNVRKLMIDILHSIFIIHHDEGYIHHLTDLSKYEIANCKQRLEEVENRLALKFSDERIKILPYVIAILLKRISKGKWITDSYHIDYEELSDTKEFEATEILIQNVERIPKVERLFITLQLLTANTLEANFLTKNELSHFIDALRASLDLFEKIACVYLLDKESLLKRLILHMKPAYYRIKYHLTTEYSMLEKVLDEFKPIHYIVKDSIKPLEEYIGTKIPENEMRFISIIIGSHLINHSERIQKKKKAVVVCPNGISISNLMESSLKELFPELYFYRVMSIREFEKKNLDIDIVFSPVPLQTDKQLFLVDRFIADFDKFQLRQRVIKELFNLNSPIINVNEIIHIVEKYSKIEEKQQLIGALENYFSVQETTNLEKKQNYHLSDLITPERIVFRDTITSWEEAIKAASEPLLHGGCITEHYIQKMIQQYPAISPHIVLRMNIAIPHASPEDGVNKIGMSLLKINDGILLDDRQRVHVIVVIAAVDKNEHFQALMQLMKLAESSKDIEKIIQMEEKDEVHRLINYYSH
ncbi:BglG family transcription antiterminator [Heyndrickxia ginsengihumi]|uniref:Ascorbate-specific PTS system EIIA component n=1 Tax=Heyndrickxia ginsengihumi TaxID=363870 RepID=A0A0A6VDU3_9BACI|nr:BglG family transcription antiterminator [Heyndrickxia ginsengihumi]KHD84714.1 PTS sugar transporter subunit IIA [Heyndrickxia ginsengihumi]MBE6183249.1 BglG family transcription antiterminator [Bacillus sp. (in: firmicutes)]MCM3023014.1 BglG family transcription antiterminator [Heyndrickxia ginsengihumi]NEY19484.1 BglG family transcription antiterminator [Heyndrickxia ginsengihumi]